MSFHCQDGQRVSVKGGDEKKKSGFHCQDSSLQRTEVINVVAQHKGLWSWPLCHL